MLLPCDQGAPLAPHHSPLQHPSLVAPLATPPDGSPRTPWLAQIPFHNTTAVIRELQPGATYKFKVQSLATAYENGGAASTTLTLPAPPANPGVAPQPQPRAPRTVVQLAAKPSGAGRAEVRMG
jgi:hypothetical protein